ncbi:MAG: HTH-type transcriptional regulator GltR [Holosporales bacterium]
MDLNRLHIFQIVAKEQSLTGAGNALELSQSAVSRHMSQLEQDMDCKLFLRHARGLSLTEEGELLYRTINKISALLNTTESLLNDYKETVSGTLKIAATTAVATVWLPKRLPLFMNKYPDLKLEFILTDGDIDFSTREADVAIRFANNAPQYSDLIIESLFKVRFNVYGSKAYLDSYTLPLKKEDLSQHRLIIYGAKTAVPASSVNILLKLGAKIGDVRKPCIEVASAFGILECVRAGLGLGLIADYIAHDYPELIPVFRNVIPQTDELVMMYPKHLKTSKRIRALSQFLKDVAFS